jgi:outer membrane protein assembly factor BamB
MTASSTRFIVCGYVSPASPPGATLGFIRAFDVSTGTPKWGKDLTLGANYNTFTNLIVNGDVVMVRGSASSWTMPTPPTPIYTLLKRFYRAYQADTGQLLWEDVRDFEGFNVNSATAYPLEAMVVSNNRVFTAAQKLDSSYAYTGPWILRGYQLKSITTGAIFLMEKLQ